MSEKDRIVYQKLVDAGLTNVEAGNNGFPPLTEEGARILSIRIVDALTIKRPANV